MRRDRAFHGIGERHWSYEAGRGVEKDIHRAAELYRQAAQEVPEARQAVRRLEKTGRTQRIAGWALVTYAILMGAGLWEGSAGDRIIWLAAAALPAMAGGCCLHYGRRLAPPLSRIGRIALTVLGAVLAFLFAVGVVVLLDPAEAVEGQHRRYTPPLHMRKRETRRKLRYFIDQ